MRGSSWGVLSLAASLAVAVGCANDDAPVAVGGDASASGSASGTQTDTNTSEATTMTSVAEGSGSAGLDSTGGSGSTSLDGTTSGSGSTSLDGTTSGTSSDTSSTGPGEQCGNDLIEGAEDCDGSDLAGEDCISQGFDAGSLACLPDCTLDTSSCVMFSCGNDAIEGMEACDGNDLAGEDCISQGFDAGSLACLPDCSAFDTSACLAFACGNDTIEGMEACDGFDLAGEDCISQGFDAGSLACLPDCSAFDTSACIAFACGNDVIEGTETCDGSDLAAQTCISQGFDAGSLACLPDCSAFDTSACLAFACGNDVIEGAEICDGSDLAAQTCVSQGFSAGSLACLPDCSAFDTSACVTYSGDCCAAHGTPGCDDPGCTAAICAADPFCCNSPWDASCANAAIVEPACQSVGGSCPDPMCGNDLTEVGEACDGTDLVGQSCNALGFDGGGLACLPDCSGLDTSGCFDFAGDCCAAHGTPGCDDPGCTAAVCAADPTCCTNPWDAMCAAAATNEPACQDVGGSCPACGDGVIEGLEACDGANLQGQTCITQGFDGGPLTCLPDCSALDPSACQLQGFGDCVNNPPAAVCLPGEQCITDLAIPPTVGVCTDVTCTNVGECPLAPPGGTAPVQCVDVTGEGVNECILFCGLPGLLCPPGMVCQLGLACAWPN